VFPVIRILVVDDEPQIHRFLRPVLSANGYLAERADTGRAALSFMHNNDVAAVLLDLGLPDLDGLQVLNRLRVNSQVPVIVISARAREEEKIAALDAGADDYLEKPFGIGELLARIRVALRHRLAAADTNVSDCISFPGLTIDSVRRLAHADGKPLILTPKEWDLLRLFSSNAGRVLTHRQILKAVWGSSDVNHLQYLRVYIRHLRQKLGESGALISTETGVGYRMADCLPPNQPQVVPSGDHRSV
jgi:two-component system KDP operon response regulator KdpE